MARDRWMSGSRTVGEIQTTVKHKSEEIQTSGIDLRRLGRSIRKDINFSAYDRRTELQEAKRRLSGSEVAKLEWTENMRGEYIILETMFLCLYLGVVS